jgi:FixJ family two-component response regulator
MGLVATGLLNKQVAAELGTSEKTIKVHRARVMDKMGAESLPALVRMAEHVAPLQPDDRPGIATSPPSSPRGT